MDRAVPINFSGPALIFHERRLPVRARPAGYAALIDAYGLKAPWPRTLFGIGEKHKILRDGGWEILSPRHAPAPTLEGHLTFALKNEGLDLAVLKALFRAVGGEGIKQVVGSKPSGSYARRIWFLYEWLLGDTLDLPEAKTRTYVDVVDVAHQYGVAGTPVRRQRVRNNLPGTPAFCPLVFRTEALEALIAQNLSERARDIVRAVPRDLLARTAAFLLLKDSRSSFAIEGEASSHDRIQRWGRAIAQAGTANLDLAELLRLQAVVIGDNRFVKLGLRNEGGFIGEHDRQTGAPIPDHIDARHEDLPALIEGLIAFDNGPGRQLDPVIAAAVLAFGFIYIHPFQDGNGRIHRYLVHHVLAQRGFNPPGLVFPVSAAILERIDDYRQVLESYSARLLPLIEWRATDNGNVEVLNDTADFYRFFDATPQAEFLFECVRKTIEVDLPEETRFLRAFDQFTALVSAVVDMPARTIDLLFRFLHQNGGRLSKRAQNKEFDALSDYEVIRIEAIYAESFHYDADSDADVDQ
ncbi:MAG: Fic family protein [Hyphomicrobiales bacterium]|nr:Fic family protein [Hyphomicrobiales bacterium]